MKLRYLALALALTACGGESAEPEAAPDSAAAPTSGIPGYDPDTTMAPPPVMDSSMQGAVPATDTTGGR
jgi:hypothetical protein